MFFEIFVSIVIGRFFKSASVFISQTECIFIIDSAGNGYYYVLRLIMSLSKVYKILPRNFSHCLARAGNIPTKWIVWKYQIVIKKINVVFGVIFIHVDLFNDDSPLLFNFALRQCRIQKSIGQDINSFRQNGSGCAYIIIRVFLACAGIIFRPNSVKGFTDCFGRRVFNTALEGHMLEKMTDARERLPFIARAHTIPDSKSGRLKSRNRNMDEADAVSEDRALKIHYKIIADAMKP